MITNLVFRFFLFIYYYHSKYLYTQASVMLIEIARCSNYTKYPRMSIMKKDPHKSPCKDLNPSSHLRNSKRI